MKRTMFLRRLSLGLACGAVQAEAPAVSSGPAVSELESRHQALEAEISRKLDEIDRQIMELRRRADSSEASIKAHLDQKIRQLQQMKPILARKLADLNIVWTDLRTSLQQTAQELQKILGSLSAGATEQRR